MAKWFGFSTAQFLKVVLGVAVFGFLMAVRIEFEQIWLRTLVAASAGGILVWALLQAKKNKL